jgi:hypothetical protein
MTGLRRLWRGELPLAEAFWTWAVFVGLAINLVSLVISLILVTEDRAIAALIASHAIALPYNFIATVGVWRSAARHPGERGWADAARIATVIMMVLLSVI